MPKIKRKAPGIITFKTPSNLPKGVSKEETELYNIIQLEFPSKKIERSNRQILNGRELDMYIPENKFAVEFDGVYFHSTAKKDDSFYHLWKTIECEKRGIRLFHVLSDEWELKRPLVIDIIRKALGKYQLIDAKDCYVEELSKKEEEIFVNSNHLSGDFKNSALCLGLSYNNICIMTISFAKTENLWTICRITTLRNILVKDGLKKLLIYFRENYFSGDLYASIDRRFEADYDLFENNFKEIEPSNPNATYTKDFQHRYKQSDFKKFDEKTLIENGWQKIYDCGRRRFILK